MLFPAAQVGPIAYRRTKSIAVIPYRQGGNVNNVELDENDKLTHLSLFKTRCWHCDNVIRGTLPNEQSDAWAACECGATSPAKNVMVWH